MVFGKCSIFITFFAPSNWRQKRFQAFHQTKMIFNYRIYFTDATPDNIVINDATLRLSFVDLDSVIIVDSHIAQKNTVNRHEQIDCDYCFAFIPDELCSYHLTDINLFSVCQVCFDLTLTTRLSI